MKGRLPFFLVARWEWGRYFYGNVTIEYKQANFKINSHNWSLVFSFFLSKKMLVQFVLNIINEHKVVQFVHINSFSSQHLSLSFFFYIRSKVLIMTAN